MKKGLIIELTPLLDVILIMLFFIITTSTNNVNNANNDNNSPSNLQEANEQIKELNEKVNSYAILDENALVITMSLKTTSSDKRILTVKDENKTIEKIELTWDNSNYASNSLQSILTSQIKSQSDYQVVFLVLQYDKSTVYNSDYKLASNILTQMQTNHKNVYTASYDYLK